MTKHVTISTDSTRIEIKGEVLFDPQDGTLSILGKSGYITFNWNQVEFFLVQDCEECEDEDNEED